MSQPLTLNLYTYVGNNPLIYVDPSGNVWEWVGDAWNLVKGTADALLLDDLCTLSDPNTSLMDKGIAAAGFIPVAKVFKGAKLLNKFASGNKVIQASKVAQKANMVIDINVKPIASNQKLQNIVRDLYKGQKMPNIIGNGTTMDAIRHELKTGKAVGGRFHDQKGTQYSKALDKLMNNGNLNKQDKNIAELLYSDLQKALKGN